MEGRRFGRAVETRDPHTECVGVIEGSAGATTETEEETNQAVMSRPWPAMDYKYKEKQRNNSFCLCHVLATLPKRRKWNLWNILLHLLH